ncbi:MAG: DUF1887 family protein [Oscillochloris sp.]|nr:DUF1887 family protein [Oscillochloris sp.]
MDSPRYDVLISPISRQPLLVLLPILEYKPDATYLIPTPDARSETESVRRIVRQIGGRVVVREAVGYAQATEMLARCRAICGLPQLAGRRVAINISGALPLIAMGAQWAARELGLPMLYVHVDEGEIIHIAPDGAELARAPISAQLSVEHYVDAHDVTLMSGLPPADPYVQAARALGQAGTASAGLLSTIRASLQQHGQQHGMFAPMGRSAVEFALINTLLEQQLIESLPDDGIYTVSITHPHVDTFFMGGWLRIYVADACVRSGHFDEVRCNVRLKRNQAGRTVINELDVIAISRGRLAAIACTIGSQAAGTILREAPDRDRQAVFELDGLLHADLMGLAPRKVLVTNQPRLNSNLANRAYFGQTCCISGARLPDVARIVYAHLRTPQLGLE